MERDRLPTDSDWSMHRRYVPLVSHWTNRKLYLIGSPTVSLKADEPMEEQIPMEVESSLNQNLNDDEGNKVETPQPTAQSFEDQWGISTSHHPVDTPYPLDDQHYIYTPLGTVSMEDQQ